MITQAFPTTVVSDRELARLREIETQCAVLLAVADSAEAEGVKVLSIQAVRRILGETK